MADSDGEYQANLSDDEEALQEASGYGTRAKGKGRADGRAKKAWEASAQKSYGTLREGADGRIAGLEQVEEERKRKRLRQDTAPFQRGIIRHLVLILDCSESMLEKDFRPNRYAITLAYAAQYIREFYEQNPISQLSVMIMHDGLCTRLTEMSGNPQEHISALQGLRDPQSKNNREPKGAPSLQNALEMARATLFHTPSHGTREVIIVLGALLSLDPGDIHATIRKCASDRVRVGIIGMGGRMKICQEICSVTNAGDDSVYGVAIDQQHLRELLMATTTPPVIRQSTTTTAKNEQIPNNPASLLMMGFPSRHPESTPTVCACHGNLTRGGYTCSRCKAKVCSLPATCPACGLTLILSTHLARSYHHLFPLRNWIGVSWERARQRGSRRCKGCMVEFPLPPKEDKGKAAAGRRQSHPTITTTNGHGPLAGGFADARGGPGKVTNGHGTERDQMEIMELEKKDDDAQGASESSRYECTACGHHFCIDCDLFCHEVLHNCPGCLSGGNAVAEENGANGEAMEV